MSIIPYGKQEILQEDIDHLESVLRSNYLTQGPKLLEFEEYIKKITGAKHAIATSNGTTALHLAVKVLSLNENDLGITTPITFVASANCMLYENLNIDLVDIDSQTFCIDTEKIIDRLENDRNFNPKVIVVVHFAGFPIDLRRLGDLCKKKGIYLIEDASHALGAYSTHDNIRDYVGSCKYSDLTTFSFHPVKHIACGEGGLITCNNSNFAKKIEKLRSHGITKNVQSWEQDMEELGYNYRLSDINAALGLSQLKRLEKNIKTRNHIAEVYKSELNGVGDIDFQYTNNKSINAYHLFIIKTEKRKELYYYLREKEIYTQVHYVPIHFMTYYNNRIKNKELKSSEDYYSKCLSLPMYHSLSEQDHQRVITEVKKFYER